MTRLSATDALFHYADSPKAPQNMGSVQILSLPDDYDGDFFQNFREFIADRLEYLPKLKMRLVSDVLGLPHLVPYDDFDLDYHVRRTRVKNDDEMEVFRKLGRLQHLEFDLDKPLFMFYVVEGLKDGRIAILQKFHHSLADGKTAVKIMTLFTDEGPAIFGDDKPEPERDSPGMLRRMLSGGLEDVRRTAASLPAILDVVKEIRTPDGQNMLRRTSTRPVTIFNKTLSHRRVFAMRDWPLESFTTVRRALGLTFVEAGLTLLSGAVRRYLDERDELPVESLICNVPVAVQTQSQESGNSVLAMWVPIGTDIEDRSERIKVIKSEAEAGKRLITKVQEAAQSGQGVQLPSMAMRFMGLSMGSGLINRWNPPPGNIALSSVPVSATSITVAGAHVESLYGMPMIMHGAAVSVTISTYEDKVVVGLLCCEKALPDPDRLLVYMQDELEAMDQELSKKRLRDVTSTPIKKKRAKKMSRKRGTDTAHASSA